MAHILFVEDDPALQTIVASVLRNEGHQVRAEADGKQALQIATDHAFDLILLDVSLPSMTGHEVAMSLRSRNETPIMMLTAYGDDDNILTGLAMGADEYVTKPISPVVLAAKIRSLLRRSQGTPEPAGHNASEHEVLRIGSLTVDGSQWRVTLGPREITLTAKEFRLVYCLVRHRERVMSREAILTEAWGEDFDGSDRVVDVSMSRLRRHLFNLDECPVNVQAITGVGYKLIIKSPT